MLMNARWFARDVGILKCLRLAYLIAANQTHTTAFCRDELCASRLQIRSWSRRFGRSRVLSFGDYRRRVVTGQQNDAHQRCGLPPPIHATQHQTNSAIALQKCRNHAERSGLKGCMVANNHAALQWPETNTTKQPNITKTPPRPTVPPPNIMARVTMPRVRNTPPVLSSIRRPRISIVIKPIQRVSSRSSQQRRPGSTPGLFSWALLHSPSLEETGVRGVLLDIGGIALLGGIHFGFCLCHVFACFGIVTGALVASIGRGHGRHFIVT